MPDKPKQLDRHGGPRPGRDLTWKDPGDDSIAGYVILQAPARTNDPSGYFHEYWLRTPGAAAISYTDDHRKCQYALTPTASRQSTRTG